MRSVFDNHVASTHITDNISNLILYLDVLQFFFGRLNRFIKIRIKITYYRLPVYSSLFNTVKKCFHSGSKININNSRECLKHYVVDCFAKLCHIKVLILLGNISSCNYCCYCRCISTWTSYSKFFKCLNKRCLRIMSRRLRKMLLLIEIIKLEL